MRNRTDTLLASLPARDAGAFVTEAAASPLDATQLQTLAETRTLARKLRFARGLALTNVVSLGGFALLSIVFAAFELELSPLGLAMGVLAWNEHQGRQWLVAADTRAARRLALNQVALLAVVLVYCAWNAYTTWWGPDPLASLTSQSTELNTILDQSQGASGMDPQEIGGWIRSAALLVYAAVAGVSVLVQGAMAYYYASLRGTLVALAAAPAWARALL